MSMIWIRLDGMVPATEVAPHTDPTWETLADGGCGAASWAFSSSPFDKHHAVRRGALVEILCGSLRLYVGRLVDDGQESGECVAEGLHRDAYTIPALDSLGAATRDINTALVTALAAPWLWRMVGSLSGLVDGESTDPLMVGDLLDQFAEQTGQRWGQDANARLYMRSDPTAPQWLVTPGDAVLGTTSEGTATHLVGRYFNGTDNQTVVVGTTDDGPARAELVNLVERGTLTEAEAGGILTAALNATRSQASWTNGLTLMRDQITTMGGESAALEAIRAGDMVRLHGLSSIQQVQAQGFYEDFVIGRTSMTASANSIYIEPVKLAPRTLAAVIAAA